ncbi:hypothetical protein GCM10023219_26450 [Stakelama sediminis]|uniref:PilZ domain-containing protein n=1 Tax=Stakelama sediminis TaxID=463200 RepID=A0A840YYF0_9SPHN|nr:PilZ domain-containing protein [Stakelama sediminis]MBB5718673.1 hypothetical protein [Stakelama sediminis]
MKPREMRQTVLIQARMRGREGWSDVLIHNVSAHGMLLRSATAPRPGTYLEIRKSTTRIIARAVWSKGQFCGVRTQDIIDINRLLSNAAEALGAAIGLSAPGSGDRRTKPRQAVMKATAWTAERNRHLGAKLQFIAVAVVVALMATFLFELVMATLSSPFEEAVGSLKTGQSL